MNVLDTPKFKTSKTAEAAGLKPATLRAYFSHGWWRIIGKRADGEGLPNLFSARDAVTYAVAARLIQIAGIHPEEAFKIASERLTQVGGFDSRAPGQLFNVNEHGKTLLAYYPDTKTARLIAEDDVQGLSDLLGYNQHEAEAVTVIVLNYLVARVYAAMGVEEAAD